MQTRLHRLLTKQAVISCSPSYKQFKLSQAEEGLSLQSLISRLLSACNMTAIWTVYHLIEFRFLLWKKKKVKTIKNKQTNKHTHTEKEVYICIYTCIYQQRCRWASFRFIPLVLSTLGWQTNFYILWLCFASKSLTQTIWLKSSQVMGKKK